MAYVYFLKSLKNGRYYIGSTNDLKRRIKEHHDGNSKYTKFTRPFELVFSQEFSSLLEARRIEHKLKSFKSRVVIEKIIKDKVIKIKWH